MFFKNKTYHLSKKASHVGIIASFSIFVLFLIGIYLFSQPFTQTSKEQDVILNYLEKELTNAFSENLTVAIISGTAGNRSIIEMALVLEDTNVNYTVKDKNGVNRLSFKNLNQLIVLRTYEDVLWVYFSKAYLNPYGEPDIGGDTISPTISSVRVSKEIFEEKIINGINNFEDLKSNLTISQNIGFGFSFEMSNGTIIGTEIKQTSKDIFTKEVPIEYYNSYADKLNGKIRISIW